MLDTPQFESATSVQKGLDAPVTPYPSGKENLAKGMLDAVSQTGEGFVTYSWSKPLPGGGESTESYPKLSYVKLFKPWNWIIGMGDYIDGIDKDVAAEAAQLNATIHTIVTKLIIVSVILLVGMGLLT